MNWSRREMLLVSMGLLIGGCTQRRGGSVTRPGAQWPDQVARPSPQQVAAYPVANRTAAAPERLGQLTVIPRSNWTRSGPNRKRVDPMNGVNRITVHHEGNHSVWFSDTRSVANHLEKIRKSHTGQRGWGDVGYHYMIDRAGRVWEGRDARYQGAHVADNNEHNIGVMCIGNFDTQRPSDAQIQALRVTLRSLMAQYRVPVRRIYTHQELKPTACPGRGLQPKVVALRSGGYLA